MDIDNSIKVNFDPSIDVNVDANLVDRNDWDFLKILRGNK